MEDKPASSAGDLRKRINLARCTLITDYPFFSLVLALTPKASEDVQSYCATDGKKFFYSQLLDNLSDDEIVGCMVHEVLHVALGHTNGHRLNRSGGRNSLKWNMACDIVINSSIILPAGLSLPEGTMRVDSLPFKLDPPLDKHINAYSAEEIYERIPDSAVEGEMICGLLDPKTGEEDGRGEPKRMSDVERQIWAARLRAAVQQHKGRGTLPGGIEELLERLRPPKKNWREELAQFVQRVFEDYTWCPPDKRSEGIYEGLSDDILLPSLGEGDRIADLVIALDTSGSISHDDLVDFYSEVTAIALVGANLHFVLCDAAVQHFGELDVDQIPHPKGRGGTSFDPVFSEIAERGLNVEGLVYMTDGYAPFPEEPPSYPVIWVINNEEITPPWGRCIRYERKDIER